MLTSQLWQFAVFDSVSKVDLYTHTVSVFPYPSQIYSLHPLQDFQGYVFHGFNLEEDSQEPCVSSDHIFHKGLYYTPVMSGLGPDVYQFLRVNVLYIT